MGIVRDSLDLRATAIVDAAFQVHARLGPGLLEAVYEKCLVHLLERRGIPCRRQVALPIRFEGLTLDGGLRLDLVVDDRIIVELKAVERLLPVHRAQVLSYLRLSGFPLGFLINFNVPLIKEGIQRIIHSPGYERHGGANMPAAPGWAVLAGTGGLSPLAPLPRK